MMLADVKRETGLTRKAIEYYCNQEIVSPLLLENGYRDFSNSDVVTLKEVSLYRKLSLSIKEIKSILKDKKELAMILHQRKSNLEIEKEQVSLLQRLVSGEEILDISLEVNNLYSKSSLINQILERFPGYIGRIFSVQFQYYLEDTIKTQEQSDAFDQIIDFLDNMPPLVISEKLSEYLNACAAEITDQQIEEVLKSKEQSIHNSEDFLKGNKDFLEEYIKYKTGDKRISAIEYELQEMIRNFCQSTGYYEIVIPAMRVLSPSYDDFYKQLQVQMLYWLFSVVHYKSLSEES